MATSPINVYLAGAETTDKSEFDPAYTGVTNSSSSPLAGARSFIMDMTNSGTPAQRLGGMGWARMVSYKNWSLVFKMALSVTGAPTTPADPIVLCNDGTENPAAGDVIVKITTAGKISVTTNAGTTTGTTVLGDGTQYRVEIRTDKTGEGKVFLRLYDTTPTLLETITTTCANNSSTVFNFGDVLKSGTVTDAACSVKIDDICLLTVEATDTTNPPWWNATTLVYGTTDAAGTNNDYTAVGSASKWLNVDDYAPNNANTDYNGDGVVVTTRKQDHSLATPTIAGTLKGFCVHGLFRDEVVTETDGGTKTFVIIDNSVEYTQDFSARTGGTYYLHRLGYRYRPDGSSLANTDIGAMHAGSNIYLNTHSSAFSTLRSANGGGSPQTVARKPTGDSATDNLWLPSTGVTKFGVVDDDIGVNAGSTDWIQSVGVAGTRQGFTFGAFTPATGQVVTGITLRTYNASNEDGTVRGGTYKGYVLISGVYYYTSTATTMFGDHQYTWATKPNDASNWAAGDIATYEWGVEVVSVSGIKHNAVDGFNIVVNCRSRLLNTSIFVLSADGDAYTEVVRPGGLQDPIMRPNFFLGPMT